MVTQLKQKKRLTAITACVVILTFGGFGCRQTPVRVYKVAGIGPRSADTQPAVSRSKSPDKQLVSDFAQKREKKNDNYGTLRSSSTKTAGFRQQNKYADIPGPTSAEMETHSNREYHIGCGDVLTVKIYQLFAIETDAVLHEEVGQNGCINLPLLNDVFVRNLTLSEVQRDLVAKLAKEFLVDPKVDVTIKRYNSKMVMVMGQVRKPGPIVLESDSSTLLDVINKAGGMNIATAPEIEILRGAYNPSGRNTRNFWSLDSMARPTFKRELVPVSQLYAQDGRIQNNPVIYPGDVIKVRPIREGFVYVLGEVDRPGSKDFRRPLTFLQLITCAGGTTSVAAEDKCKIIRIKPDGREKEILVDLKKIRKGEQKNILIAQNDTILIPAHPVRKFFHDIGQFFQLGVQSGMQVIYDPTDQVGIPSPADTRGGD